MNTENRQDRNNRLLDHMAKAIRLPLPVLPKVERYDQRGFRLIPAVHMKDELGGAPVMAHTEGGYWIARMALYPQECHDGEVKRLLEVYRAECESGKPRYIEVSDFAVMQLVRIYCLFKDKVQVSGAVWDKVEQVMKDSQYAPFHEPMSENHKICHLSSELVSAYRFGDNLFYDGISGKDRLPLLKRSIKEFLCKRLRYGWGEFDSISYGCIDLCALLNLYDFQPDQEIKRLTAAALNALLAGLLHHSVNGCVGGAKGRVYINDVSNANGGMFWAVYLATGFPENPKANIRCGMECAFMATSAFTPDNAVIALAHRKVQEPYEVRERDLLYTIPDDLLETGSVKRYFYVDKDYCMGSIVQRDEYSPSSMHAWLAGHQEQSWSVVFGSNPKAVIFSGHPGHAGLKDWGMHYFWLGDTNCLCGRYMQHKSVLVGMNVIKDEGQLKYIHFYIPRQEFDEILEEDGWLLARCGRAVAAIWASGGYYWSTNGQNAHKEIIVLGARTAFAVEMFETDDIRAVMNRLKGRTPVFDGSSVSYEGACGDSVTLYENGDGLINGKAADFSNYPLYGSRYVQAEFGSGRIQVEADGIKGSFGI